jgi:large subunit ribosomal protein L23
VRQGANASVLPVMVDPHCFAGPSLLSASSSQDPAMATFARVRVYFPQIPLVVLPKGNNVTTKGTIAFRVPPSTGKLEVKNWLQKVYGVGVIKVNTMNYRGKLKRDRYTNYRYRKADWKKAIVTVDNTDFLDLLTQDTAAQTTTKSP